MWGNRNTEESDLVARRRLSLFKPNPEEMGESREDIQCPIDEAQLYQSCKIVEETYRRNPENPIGRIYHRP